MNAPTARSGIRIRTAAVDDADTLVELASLVDLHLPSAEVPAALAPMRHALADTDDSPLSHRYNHFLIAEDAAGIPVGLLTVGPPKWMSDPTIVPKFMRPQIVRRLATIHMLAVRPEYRRRGVARALLQHTEQTFRQAGYAALTLRHDRDLVRFYRQFGFTTSSRLSLTLPTQGLRTVRERGWKHSFKVLSPDAAITIVQGMPTITGVVSA
ncbi:GNAT family N-acetyltransferase [Streptomyces graminilatus]|uniref:GNAT family N-acetyltransferase n=1 Tax=Streptomyces graminilatus TaxID=1464070 RepID=UPI00099E490B|nr:GNAT family N-acetyltransferase [Streptomyces graminilatus]